MYHKKFSLEPLADHRVCIIKNLAYHRTNPAYPMGTWWVAFLGCKTRTCWGTWEEYCGPGLAPLAPAPLALECVLHTINRKLYMYCCYLHLHILHCNFYLKKILNISMFDYLLEDLVGIPSWAFEPSPAVIGLIYCGIQVTCHHTSKWCVPI